MHGPKHRTGIKFMLRTPMGAFPGGPFGHPVPPPGGPFGHPVDSPGWALWAPRGPPRVDPLCTPWAPSGTSWALVTTTTATSATMTPSHMCSTLQLVQAELTKKGDILPRYESSPKFQQRGGTQKYLNKSGESYLEPPSRIKTSIQPRGCECDFRLHVSCQSLESPCP